MLKPPSNLESWLVARGYNPKDFWGRLPEKGRPSIATYYRHLRNALPDLDDVRRYLAAAREIEPGVSFEAVFGASVWAEKPRRSGPRRVTK